MATVHAVLVKTRILNVLVKNLESKRSRESVIVDFMKKSNLETRTNRGFQGTILPIKSMFNVKEVHMKKNQKSNCIKILILIIISVLIFLIAFQVGRGVTCDANEMTTEECKAKIEENKLKIAQCEDIKTQLHITAEMIRGQENYDASFVDSLSAKWHSQNDYQNNLKLENEKLEQIVEDLNLKHRYIGDFKITYYCVENYHHICNNGNASITATGTVPTPGRTIAVDPRKIPYGSKVVIDGHTYIAEDCGGLIKGNKIDICVSSHTEAYQRGVRNDVPVYLIEE